MCVVAGSFGEVYFLMTITLVKAAGKILPLPCFFGLPKEATRLAG